MKEFRGRPFAVLGVNVNGYSPEELRSAMTRGTREDGTDPRTDATSRSRGGGGAEIDRARATPMRVPLSQPSQRRA